MKTEYKKKVNEWYITKPIGNASVLYDCANLNLFWAILPIAKNRITINVIEIADIAIVFPAKKSVLNIVIVIIG